MKVLRLTGAGAVHSCEQMGELGPLGGSDILAHVDDAVHGYVRVSLHQAATQEEHDNTHLKLKDNETCEHCKCREREYLSPFTHEVSCLP